MRTLLVLLFLVGSAHASLTGLETKFGRPELSFEFVSDENSIEYKPNPLSELVLGFHGEYFTFWVQLTSEIEQLKETQRQTGYSDWYFTTYSDRLLIDLYYQSYSGFYIIEEDFDNADVDEEEGSVEVPNVSASNFGANFYYFTNNEFSLTESHSEYVRNPTTNGSFIIGGNFNHHEIEGDPKIIPLEFRDDFSTLKKLESVKMDSALGSIGHSYLYAWESWFISYSFSYGYGFSSKELTFSDKKKEEGDDFTAMQLFSSVAMYKADYQVGIRALYNDFNTNLEDVDYSYQRYMYYLYILLFI